MRHIRAWEDVYQQALRDYGNDPTAAMTACGRWCAAQSAIPDARAVKLSLGNTPRLDDLLQALNARGLGGGWLHRRSSDVVGIYNRCRCPSMTVLASKYPSFHNCTRGWLTAVFETVLGQPVEVKLVRAICLGDRKCEFVVSAGPPEIRGTQFAQFLGS